MRDVKEMIAYAKNNGIKLPFANAKKALTMCLKQLNPSENVVDIIAAYSYLHRWNHIYLATDENRLLWAMEDDEGLFSVSHKCGVFELNNLLKKKSGCQTVEQGITVYETITLTSSRKTVWGTEDALSFILPEGMAEGVYQKILDHAKKYGK